ncbi:MAG: hypothetical protein M1832_000216 [Thelocarpon impressellum]|nr:MAG: hypothetical protein M1832_000216 [Thelocarpon impressellum]
MPIPSAAEIRALGVALGPKDGYKGVNVVRLGSDTVVKYGYALGRREADNMRFVAAHTNVLVPKVVAAFSDFAPHQGAQVEEHFVIMTLLPGQTLESALPSLTLEERLEIGALVRLAVDELRSLTPPGYLGGVDHGPVEDGIFVTVPPDPTIGGPFDDEEAFNEGMIRRIRQLRDEHHTNLLRTLLSELGEGHRTVFTHGDLQAKNIMVERLDEVDPAKGPRFKVGLVDFEVSGWYPEYWEYASASAAAIWRPQWHEMMQQASILDPYPLHYLLLDKIRSIVMF